MRLAETPSGFVKRGIGCIFVVLTAVSATGQDPREAHFETRVRPLLAERCIACHGPQLQSGKLDLTKSEDVRRVVIEGDPDASRLMAVLSHEDEVKMPPTGKLPGDDIEALRRWIESGAVWPEARATGSGVDHWAFQPFREPGPPAVNSTWAKTPLDRYILARLEEQGLEPAPPAGKLALLRRAKFDLHGLPPTLEEIELFLSDENDEAFARLVERLLAAPEYGERWGRHWLDVARFADSTGVDEDHPYPHAWRYRDYVIAAFNEDLPYDQFVREQIAGDLLPAREAGKINARGIIATGFLGLGPKALAQRDEVQKKYDVVDEQIDTTTKTFLGLTVACSRCHDHKFDPILTTDYYAFASIFASTRSFEDWSRDGSESLATPLVEEDVYRPFKESREKIAARKRIRSAAKRLGVERYRLEHLIPAMSADMLQARAAYSGGEAAPQRLAQWVAFLRPRPDAPSYLKPWHDADDEGAESFARERQSALMEVAAKRVAALAAWVDQAEAGYQAGKDLPLAADLPSDSLYTGLCEDDAPFDVSDEDLESASAETHSRLKALQEEIEELEAATPPEPPMANAVSEGQMVDQRVFVRGSYKNEGEPVAKRFPIVLAGEGQPHIESGSGRRELGEWLVSPDNPLPARVMVNRVWQWHFGEGLVRTPNNFGKIGEPPTHPELLDHLAAQFVADGWSIKSLHRAIMSSAAYQMGSRASEISWESDPENRLWSRFPRRRLSVEELRDSYLALSGRLNRAMGGTLDEGSDAIPEFERNNRRLDPDDYDRRTVYIPLMRNKIPFMLGLFDFGDATTTMGRRTVSNVAPQALYLMNSEFAARSAAAFVKTIADSDDFVGRAYLAALTRAPSEEERAEAERFLAQFPSLEAGRKSFAKMLLASNEFHYVD